MGEAERTEGKHCPLDPTPFSSTPPECGEHGEALDAWVRAGKLDSQPEEGDELEQTLLPPSEPAGGGS